MLACILRHGRQSSCLVRLRQDLGAADTCLSVLGITDQPYDSGLINGSYSFRGISADSAAIQTPAEALVSSRSSGDSDTSAPVPWVSRRRLNNPPLPPWTPTKDLAKRNFLPRRMGFMMQELDRERAEAVHSQKQYPDFQAGDVLELKLTVPENRRRVATFRGLCIAKKTRGWQTAFTLRNFIANAGPIERTFPLYSPTVQELKVIERRKVRRAKLFYLRNVNPKEYRA